jgi:hypothetical protein
MPTPTYTSLGTITLGSTASTVTFSSIPATYRDLVLIIDSIPTARNNDVLVRFNADSSNTYTNVEAFGTGSSTGSGSFTKTGCLIDFVEDTQKSMIRVEALDYSATDKHKTVLTRQSKAGAIVRMLASRFPSTAAVTSLSVVASSSTFASGSTFSLYGIAA